MSNTYSSTIWFWNLSSNLGCPGIFSFFLLIHLVAACRILSMQTVICGMWDLVPWPEIESSPLALGEWRLRHWPSGKYLVHKYFDAVVFQPLSVSNSETTSVTPVLPSLSPGVCSNSCPLSRWCHLNISSLTWAYKALYFKIQIYYEL